MKALTTDDLLKRFAAGDRRACGQIMSLLENDQPGAREVLERIYPDTGRAWRIGVTGPPGAGKSTLVEGLARQCRLQQLSVGIVAVDPTSPFSGGAILGDRVRMASLFTDPGVYIRSMGSRGSLGGLAARTREVCDVLDAFGSQVILVETIGVGQAELDIAGAADTTIVVLVPESGDAIQALKAGLMEIGDIFAVNKSDREGADRVALEVETVIEMRPHANCWQPRVIKTIAPAGTGVPELLECVWHHRQQLTTTRELEDRRRRAARQTLMELLGARITTELESSERVRRELGKALELLAVRRLTPYAAVERIWQAWLEGREI